MGSKGVKMWSKKGQPVSKCAQLGSKWLKMASTPLKMGQNMLHRGPEGSHVTQRGQNGLKMASNTPKWPFAGQIWLRDQSLFHFGKTLRITVRGGGQTLKLFQFQKNLENENVQKRAKKKIAPAARIFSPQKVDFPYNNTKK